MASRFRYLLPRFGGGVRAASLWLSLMSLAFYGYWDIRYLPLLLGSICWNFWLGRCIEQTPAHRRGFLMLGIGGNLALLVGDMIIDRIFRQPKDAQTAFGTYVTKANVEAHLHRLTTEAIAAPSTN